MFQAARWRLFFWNVSTGIGLLLLIGWAVYAFFSGNIYKEVDQQLVERQTRLLDAIATNERQTGDYTPITVYQYNTDNLREPEYPTVVTDLKGQQPFSTVCFSWMITFNTTCPRQEQAPFSMDALHDAATGDSNIRTVYRDGEPERIYTFETDTPTGQPYSLVQIGHSATGEVNALHELQTLLLVVGLVGVVVSGGIGWFLSGRALVPIRKAFARQRQFTADASHELRTPLALIRANAEMLGRSRKIVPEDAELADEIVKETDHLNRLVGDLLTLARADTEALQITTRPVDLRSLVSDVHEDVQLIAQERGIASTLSLDGPVVVAGDEGRLRQLLLILLDNAIKYTDPGGQVNVGLSRAENRARLTVSDTGIGIPKDDLDHIFDRFYRVDRAREHESGGTGLGLSIAHWIVQAHRGTIRAESDLGAGTRFQVEIPIKSLPRSNGNGNGNGVE